jgi:kinesin family protein 3/17
LDSSRQIRVSENLAALDDPYSDEAISTNFSTYTFTFDHVYGEDNDQKSVYENTAREAVMSTLQGYNATIIAYGQTGTGKTYTMEGEPTKQKRGLIPRATEEIFRHIEGSASEKKKFLVRASYLQIYNEVISDLLKPDRTNLHIREDKRKGVYVEGLSEWVVRSPKEVYGLMQRGASTRATAPTKMNEISSRSHAVFIIILEQLEYVEEADKGTAAPEADGGGDMAQVFKVGKLNLVDLAGSERVRLTGATGQRLEESRKINQSLSALGNVIAALTTSGRQHIPYRDSKLTRILEDSLGGNCKTTMMAMISPALEAYVESLSTLKFANRAKNIKNEAHVNEDLDQKALLRKYEKEIKKLRSELEQKTKTVGDKRRLLQLQHQKEQAEKNKESVLIQLQLQIRPDADEARGCDGRDDICDAKRKEMQEVYLWRWYCFLFMLLRFNKEQSLARQHLPTCSIQGRCAPQTLFSP